ncbi:FEKKY domain-containing protein [Luteolibacter soli]|uniref:Lipoprotein n=1 Tax=Luteolibacter soli TaxID=3135280 RepID=A0ABU9AWR3_9BACT
MKRILLQSLAIGAFLACCGCGSSASRKGKADARADIAAGKLGLETAGMVSPGIATYERLLYERHGIQVRSVSGCVIDKKIMQHMEAYNEVMKAEISRRFGEDALEKIADEAQRLKP